MPGRLAPPHTALPFAPIRPPNFSYSQFNPFKPQIFKSPLRLPQISPIKSPNFPAKTSSSSTNSAFDSVKPYIESEWTLILQGWVFGAVSAFSLSKIVPKSAKIAIIWTDLGAIKGEGVEMVCLVVVRIVACYLQQVLLWEAALKVVCRVRVYVFERVLGRDLGFFEGGDGVLVGDVAYRISAEAADVADTLFAVLNAIPTVALVTIYLGKRLRAVSRDAHLSSAELSAYLNEVLPSVLFVKASNTEWSESLRFNKLAHTDLTKRLRKRKMKVLIPEILQVMYFGALFVLCAGFMVLSPGTCDGSRLITFMSSLVFLVEPIQGVGKAYNELKQGESAIERLFDLARFTPQVKDKPDAINLDSVIGDVTFWDISFKYRDDFPLILNGIDLHIRAGETVAFVGPSGGGKTTLVKLLLRLYDPLCGCILIDGFDIQSIQLESLRKHVGLVTQDTILFSGTVAENIGYKDLMTGIDMERVKNAAAIANAEEFINRLPHGYETNIGPRGSLLSGGQKQRLAIARVLHQNPSILLLDEATSALDSQSELLVRRALEKVMENRTVLIIAHRLETVLMADRVFRLDGGILQEIARSSLVDGHKIL